MKKTLLELTQDILEALDSEEVNSIGDTVEGLKVSSIIESTYFRLVTNRTFPEHKEFIKLTAASDSAFPTHFQYPTGVTCVEDIWYATDADYTYKKLRWMEPLDFIAMVDTQGSNYTNVLDKNGATNLRIRNNAQPTYYTSFDDDWIVCDSWDQTVSATLTSDRSRAFVVKTPTWSPHADDFTPDLDANYFPLLLEEAKLVAFSELKGGPDQANVANLSRTRSSMQYRKRKVAKTKDRSYYGR
jgi:hypothetical protein